MDGSLTIDFKDIKLPSPRTSDASMLREITQKLDAATAQVQREWDQLPPEKREAYAHLVYAALDFQNKKPIGVRPLYRRAVAAFNLFLITLKGEQEAWVEYSIAFRQFLDAILDAIERGDSAYQETLAGVFEEGLSEGFGRAMTVEDARERRRQLRNQVLE